MDFKYIIIRASSALLLLSGPLFTACDDDDLELFLIRAQEIGRYVNDGFIDCGITGRDWIYENRADVEVLTDLQEHLLHY